MADTLYTYRDATDHLVEWLITGASVDLEGGEVRFAKRATLAAYRDITNTHTWHQFYKRSGLATNAPYSTGTIEYDHTGGSVERLLTLSSGTWPTWAGFGRVLISDVSYEVAKRIDNTTIQLSANSNPGADVASGTTYQLYRDVYPLPCDCLAIDRLINISDQNYFPSYVHPNSWLSNHRSTTSPSQSWEYTIMADPNYQGTLGIFFWPPPSAATSYDFIYKRTPRNLKVHEYKTGTAKVVSANTNTAAGTGTTWTSDHVGAVIRFYSDGTQHPTGLDGSYPYAYERVITAVDSANSLDMDATIPVALTDVKYVISDPVDIESNTMLTAFQRCAEYQMAILRHHDKVTSARRFYEDALILAKESDVRSMARRGAWEGEVFNRLLDTKPLSIVNVD